MNDEDKKFIKETIENSVQNKLDAYQIKTEQREKINALKYKDQMKKDREEYIALLDQKNKKGEATLAEKFELLKTSVDNAVPQELKTAAGIAGKGISKGAAQVGAGLSTINRKIMMSNPLTAMLYNNADVFKAVGNIGMGGLKMAGGALKGAGYGVAALFNAAINSKKAAKSAKEAEENTEDTKIRHFGNLFTSIDKEKQSALGGILEEKKDWQKQVDDLHKWYLQDHRDSKKRMKVLSGGLSGLGKTMDAIKGFTELIGSKQKLILIAVLGGVAALTALAAFFVNGGFANLLKGAWDATKNAVTEPINQSFDNRQAKQEAAFKTVGQSIALSNQTGKAQQQMFAARKGYLTGISKTSVSSHKDEYGKVDSQTYSFDTGKFTPVLAPYDGTVSKLNMKTNIKDGKAQGVEWVMKIAPATYDYTPIRLEGIISPQVRPGAKFKKDDILAYATNNFKMVEEDLRTYAPRQKATDALLKDYQTRLNKFKDKNYAYNLSRLAETKTEKETDKLMNHIYHKADDSYHALDDGKGTKIADTFGTFKDIVSKGSVTKDNLDAAASNATSDLVKDISNSVSITKHNAVNQGNNNSDKAKQQSQQLKNSTQKKQQTTPPANNTKPTGVQVKAPSPNTGTQFPDKNLSQQQFEAGNSQTHNLSNVGR